MGAWYDVHGHQLTQALRSRRAGIGGGLAGRDVAANARLVLVGLARSPVQVKRSRCMNESDELAFHT